MQADKQQTVVLKRSTALRLIRSATEGKIKLSAEGAALMLRASKRGAK